MDIGVKRKNLETNQTETKTYQNNQRNENNETNQYIVPYLVGYSAFLWVVFFFGFSSKLLCMLPRQLETNNFGEKNFNLNVIINLSYE